MMKVEGGVSLVFLLLLALTVSHHSTGDWRDGKEEATLKLLRTIKRRVWTQLERQRQGASLTNTMRASRTAKRAGRHYYHQPGGGSSRCRHWRAPCEPWSRHASKTCCPLRRLVCSCNLWLQNCRCAPRAWG